MGIARRNAMGQATGMYTDRGLDRNYLPHTDQYSRLGHCKFRTSRLAGKYHMLNSLLQRMVSLRIREDHCSSSLDDSSSFRAQRIVLGVDRGQQYLYVLCL